MTNTLKPKWEEWQLTAYLLDELEPEDTARIKAAVENNPALAQQLEQLSATIGLVRTALASEKITATDQAQMAKMNVAAVLDQAASQPTAAQPAVVVAPKSFGPLSYVMRWQSLVALAGALLIAVLWLQRSGTGPSVSLLDNTGSIGAADVGVGESSSGMSTSSPLSDESKPDYLASRNNESSKGKELSRNLELADHPFVEQQAPSTAPLATSAPAPRAQPGLSAAGADSSPHPFSPAMPTSPLAPVASPTPAALTPATPTPASSSGTKLAKNTQPVPAKGYAGAAGLPNVGPASEGGAAEGMMGAGMMSGGGMGGMRSGGGMGGMMGGVSGGMMGDAGLPGIAATADRFDAEAGRSFDRLEQRLHPELPGQPGGDRFAQISDNPFKTVTQDPLSTFSIDVDTASYSKVRQYLMEYNQAPPAAAVRLEEFINSFDYQYAGPQDEKPFAAALAVSNCPWTPEHKLVRIALQAKQIDVRERPKANLVFLLDVSGSMNDANKLPLVKESIRLLTYQLQENDRVAIVVYAGAAGCVLSSTPGNRQDEILSAIDRLNAGGSTNGGQGIQLAYSMARENFIPGGVNRVILCTDGDFNVGLTGTDQLVNLVKEQAASNIFLTVLGFGMGNTNDAMMEQIADKGNGVYGFVDTRREAQRQMVNSLAGNLITVAKDVKIQVEFNPGKIRSYRLLGYENRIMAREDFNNDKKDAGEIGAGHRVTALYEVAMVGSPEPKPMVDGLRYQKAPPAKVEEPVPAAVVDGDASNELLAVKLRYKQPEGTESQLLVFPLADKVVEFAQADADFRWAAAMAEFGMLLRNSPHRGNSGWTQLFERARTAAGSPLDPHRAEALEMIRKASQLVPR